MAVSEEKTSKYTLPESHLEYPLKLIFTNLSELLTRPASNCFQLQNRKVTLQHTTYFIWESGDIFSHLSRPNTARGSSTSLVTVGPTKVQVLL